METDQQTLEDKLVITAAATELYIKHGKHFTLHQIADQTDYSVAEILNYFDNKNEILQFYYTSLIIRYRLMIDEIDDFNSYTLSEKFSNFAYTSFDLMNENEQFVSLTFQSSILHSCNKTEYQNQIQNLFAKFIEDDDLISGSSAHLLNNYFFSILQHKYLWLVKFWLNDQSEDKEVTMELTDKTTGLLQELLYTSVADRSIDLIKFLYTNINSAVDSSFYNKITSTFEIR